MTNEQRMALRRFGIFEPETHSLYADRTELTKAELILKTLDEMGLLSLSEEDPHYGDHMKRIPGVVIELQHKLPEGRITTCAAFKDVGADCCCLCHADPLHFHRMTLVELPGGEWAWLCCGVMRQAAPNTA